MSPTCVGDGDGVGDGVGDKEVFEKFLREIELNTWSPLKAFNHNISNN